VAAWTGTAVKALLEAQSLGVPIYRDFAPDGHAKPYITITEEISLTVEQSGDYGDSSVTQYGTELVQVDIWQALRNANDTGSESYSLKPAVLKALNGARLTAAPTHVYGCTVDSSVRLVERDTNTIHHAITVRLRRVL
jgi:hypothetical protein